MRHLPGAMTGLLGVHDETHDGSSSVAENWTVNDVLSDSHVGPLCGFVMLRSP